jgi:hypothetical protein
MIWEIYPEYLLGNNLERDRYGLFRGTLLTFNCRVEETNENPRQRRGNLVEIRTGYFPNTSCIALPLY